MLYIVYFFQFQIFMVMVKLMIFIMLRVQIILIVVFGWVEMMRFGVEKYINVVSGLVINIRIRNVDN